MPCCMFWKGSYMIIRVRKDLVAVRSLLHREVLRFWRVIMQCVLSPVINATLYLLIFGVHIGNHWQPSPGISYLLFLIPGLVVLGLLNNAFQNSSSSIVISKFHGDLEDLKIVPLRPWQIVWAMSLAATLRGVLVAVLVASVGALFLFLFEARVLEIAHPSLLCVFLIWAGIFFAQLGICMGFFCSSYEQLNAISSLVLQPLIYLGGSFFPLQQLSPLWQAVSRFNPVLYYTNGIRYALLGSIDLPLNTCIQMMGMSLLLTYIFSSVLRKKWKI